MVRTVGQLREAIRLVPDDTPVMLLGDGYHYADYIFVQHSTVMEGVEHPKYHRDYAAENVARPPVEPKTTRRIMALTIC